MRKITIGLCCLVLGYGSAHAMPRVSTTANGTGDFDKPVALPIDRAPGLEMSHQHSAANVRWVGTAPVFMFAPDASYKVDDVIVFAEKNDAKADYALIGNITWAYLC